MNIAANPILKTRDKKLLRSDALILNGHQRYCVKAAIREVCSMRDYTLYAINVRTNHVHLVVVATTKVESMMNAFKAYATRRLRLEGLVTSDSKIWARHGSTRYLWTDKQVGAAIEYVMYEQGEDLPEF